MSLENVSDDEIEARRASRQSVRQQAIERRLALPAEHHMALSKTLCENVQQNFPQLAAMRVAFCWPVRNEPDLRPLIESWRRGGKAGFSALLPVVRAPGAPLAFRAWQPGDPLENDRYGIATPSRGEFLVPEALLVPVNAFDAAGYRLGYGGGYFDRTLAALDPAPLSIGVGFELGRVASVHPEIHDVRLDAIVTEAGVFRSA